MKTEKYIGVFKNADGDEYSLDVNCTGFVQALFLLTADAIRSGKHYQLDRIIHENGTERKVGSIVKVTNLFI